MNLTKEQRNALLERHNHDIEKLVLSYIRTYKLDAEKYYDDLRQVAVKGFLEHLYSMPSMDCIWGYKRRVTGELVKFWKRDSLIRFPDEGYSEIRRNVQIVSHDEDAVSRVGTMDDDVDLMLEALGEGLTPEEKEALELKAKYGYKNAELQEVLGTNRMGVTRFFHKLRPRAKEYFDRRGSKEGRDGDSGLRG